ncbi:MAG: circularly permuted type 2 ATP-grasp protein [Leptospiraceae bacterium]|nr:circularly permuted type 2 ATP-grasp protein [Leptospiraceae bacterium]
MAKTEGTTKPGPGFYSPEARPDQCYDESVTGTGELRPHWRFLMESLQQLGPRELSSRNAEADRLMSEMGVTYHVFDNPLGAQSPWKLDPVPLLIDTEEWARIERGLIQRAELLNLILLDLYGEQKLVRQGLIPPELVYGSVNYLRPCVGLVDRMQRPLQIYAADLARSPDGRFWVLSDRTQAPSGAAYALENRIAMSRIFPGLYRDSQVHRLAFYFRTLHQALSALAPESVRNPRIVVLTPGPESETYFEHAFLARYLGYPLVQGADLTVLDGQVFLETLGGHKQVHVILRRLDEEFCDPLELRPDSLLGTPGLLQAARLGNVAIANPPGSGIVQNPALMAYLPQLCRHLLGSDLLIPSVATWWCGSEPERQHTLQNLDRITLRYLAPYSQDGIVLKKNNLEMLQRLERDPHLFVGQERVLLSSAPVLKAGKLEPRHVTLRTFLVARPDGYMVMPGGLTRVSHDAHSTEVTAQRGGRSKDTWVLSPEPVRPLTLLPVADFGPTQVTRGGGEIPGRVAENLYWMARNAERAEFLTRMSEPIIADLLEDPTYIANQTRSMSTHITEKLRTLTHQSFIYPGFSYFDEPPPPELFTDERIEEGLRVLLFDAHTPGSVAFAIAEMLRGAYAVRERFSDETSRIMASMRGVLSSDIEVPGDNALDALSRLSILLAAFSGMTTESMSRTDGWRFLEVGRRLERALQVVRLLRSVLCGWPGEVSREPESDQLEYILRACNSSMTYRRRYSSLFEFQGTMDLLLLDGGNPRSLAFQIGALVHHVALLPAARERDDLLEEVHALQHRLSHLVGEPGAGPESQDQARARLQTTLPALTADLENLSGSLTTVYFRTVAMRQMPREFA